MFAPMTSTEFDPAKDAANLEKHGPSLAFGTSIFGAADLPIIPSNRPQDEEERFKVVGMVEQKLFTGVFTWRDNRRRFISVRRSNRREKRAYHSEG